MNTRWTSLKRRYGLAQPYDFRRAIPFLLSLGFLCSALALGALLVARGKISYGTPRFYFVVYLVGLALTALAVNRFFRVALALCGLCALELGLGLVLKPADITPRFQYHPLLQVVPIPHYDGTLNVHVHHNSLGARGQEPGEISSSKHLLFAYGGSSTYDLTVSEGETWPEKLYEKLGISYKIINWGVPGYTTSENVIQTAFYGELKGTRPQCALYYNGWNDGRTSHAPHLDNAYADFYTLYRADSLQTRRSLRWMPFSPVFSTVGKVLSLGLDTVPRPPAFREDQRKSGTDPALDRIFLNNASTIAAINSSRGVTTVFLAQMFDIARIKRHGKEYDALFSLVKEFSDSIDITLRLNHLMEGKAKEIGAGYIDPGIENFSEDDFLDQVHFSPQGSRKFATLIAEQVRAYCP